MNTCQHCNYWEPQAPVAQHKTNMGECNKLSQTETEMKEEYLLPVLDGKATGEKKQAEILTAANFGCNQFAEA